MGKVVDSVPRRKFEQAVLIAIGLNHTYYRERKSDAHIDIGPPCSVNQRNKDLVNDAHTKYSCSNETNKLSHSVNKLYSD